MSEMEPRGLHASAPEKGMEMTSGRPEGTLASRSASHAIKPEVMRNGASIAERLHDFAENRNPYNPPERLYTDRRSEQVNRLNGQVLDRPFDLPAKAKAVLGCAVVLAAIGGGTLLYSVAEGVLLADEREQAAIEESLSKGTAIELPALKEFTQLDDEAIMSSLASSGWSIVDINAIQGQSGSGLDVYKLPQGVDAESATATAAAMLTTGLVSGSDAVELLNGGWRLQVDRGEYLNISLKYADFENQTPEEAIASALTSQGLEGTATSEISQDASGNIIQTGTIDIAGVPYAWQVSTCPLSEVYAIDGLPETAQYVGIRIHP